MRDYFDLEKEYGIVLEGGGAKGAYQIGVWKALREYGVKIKAIAGVSVGALNGALICMGDYEKAVDIWENISYSRIMQVEDEQMEKLLSGKFKEISLQSVRQQSRQFIVRGGLDVTPLKELLEETIDEKKIRESEIEFYIGTFNLSNMKEIEISAKEAEEGYLKDYLLASANFPLFKKDKLLGKKYLDGGITNNVPVDMLINRGYKNIIVVRIYGIGMEKRVKVPEDVNILYIAPKVNLCNILEFDKKKAARNIKLGYYDALRIFASLTGKEYYIKSERTEKDYLESLLGLEEEQIGELTVFFKLDGSTGRLDFRRLIEVIYPQLAVQLKLRKNWTYQELYYVIIEYCAKKLRIPKFKLYTEKDFCTLLYRKLLKKDHEEEELDIIMKVALSIISNMIKF